MAIECYYGDCKRHGNHEGEEGPFCFETKCRATKLEIKRFSKKRKEYLDSLVVSQVPSKALLIQDFLKAEEARERLYLMLFPWHKNWKASWNRTRGWG